MIRRVLPRKPQFYLHLLVGGSAGLLIASFLPIWTLWYWNPLEGLGVKRSLWTVAWETVHSLLEKPDPVFPVTRNGDVQDLGLAVIIFIAGSLLGAIVFFLRHGTSQTQA
jgi:hypothetical protein